MNPLDKHNSGNYLFGGSFLKHFYSIYDYDQELISLGINSHSEGLVDMYSVDKMKKSETEVKVKPPAKKAEETAKTADGPAKAVEKKV
jgi:flagellin-like hook-associated protein FlgL